MPDQELHRTLRRQMARSGVSVENITDPQVLALLTQVSNAYADADKQRYLHDRAFLLASQEMQSLYDRLEAASQSAALVQRDRLQAVFDSAATGLIVIEHDGRIFDINEMAEGILGARRDEVVNRSLSTVLLPHSSSDTNLAGLRLAIRDGSTWRAPDVQVNTPARADVSVALFYRAMDSGGGVLALEDITERKQAQAELLWRANHDPLTGLLNRAALHERVQQALNRSRRYGAAMAVLFIDLDRFKRVNDTLGHAAGDQLLVECGQRIRAVMREVDTVARLGGDEFVVVCENITSEHDAQLVAERLVDVLGKPFELGNDTAYVDASIGIALSDGHDRDPEVLMRDADVALYEAKAQPGGHIVSFDSGMSARLQHTIEIERRLRRGLSEDEFWVAFQPIVSLATASIAGHEALARWTPDGHEVPPQDFVPVAESAAMLNDLGRRVISQALDVQSAGSPDAMMFVNVAPSQLAADGFTEWMVGELTRSGADPRRLCLEVTETSATSDEHVRSTLRRLRDLGVRIALDDFGTGHSSLAALHGLPVDVLKVDRSLVSQSATDDRAREIAYMICELGHRLGLIVVAEGVETDTHARMIAEIGFDLAQGFLYGRPARLPLLVLS